MSAANTASASFATSDSTSGRRATPTTSSIRERMRAYRHWRAAGTLAGTIPSPGSTPVYFWLEKIAAQAASP
eukprot:1550377-Pleurochrysis_carterae.AAC.1